MNKNLLRTLLISLVFIVSLVSCFLLFSQGESVNHNQSERLQIHNNMSVNSATPTIDAVNKRNLQIKNFSCDLKATVQMPGKRPAKLNGFLVYEKERKFRLGLDSFLGPELDIGSDGNQFWFWLARMKNPGLYWSTYDNLYRSKLKTPFNPLWLSHCLSIDQIDYNDVSTDKTENKLRIIKNTVNAKKEPITVVTYVDLNSYLITGHGMYENKTLVASSEINEFNNNLPAKISFIWHKENASMIWYFSKHQRQYYNKPK
jgi:hypothetical protein